jgi:pyruvate dehydrogenase E2 component (dihydrolipoamide acetyltransferase)
MKMRADLNAGSDPATGMKLTVNDFILKSVVNAAVKVPAVNAAFAGDAILQFGSVNLSVAVAVDDGLVTPVVRDAHKKSLREVSEAVKDLATRARSKKLKPDEYQGGTITVSNLGAFGVEFFDAIINPPQAAILGVHATKDRAVVENGQIVIRPMNYLALSYDHRIIDGREAVLFLVCVKDALEDPSRLLLDL